MLTRLGLRGVGASATVLETEKSREVEVQPQREPEPMQAQYMQPTIVYDNIPELPVLTQPVPDLPPLEAFHYQPQPVPVAVQPMPVPVPYMQQPSPPPAEPPVFYDEAWEDPAAGDQWPIANPLLPSHDPAFPPDTHTSGVSVTPVLETHFPPPPQQWHASPPGAQPYATQPPVQVGSGSEQVYLSQPSAAPAISYTPLSVLDPTWHPGTQ
eukprot:73817-Rhodomonas_salina.2